MLRPFVDELLDTDSEDDEPSNKKTSRKLYTIQEQDEEIELIKTAFKSFHCACELNSSNESNSQKSNENTQSNSAKNNKLELEIGSSKIPRFCCACHKLNLAIREAIEGHEQLSSILATCNALSAEVRRSIKKSQPFRKMRCMLRCENNTRWSSSFLMILAILKAYQKGVISKNENDPNFINVNLESLEIYYKILREIHLLSLDFQKIQSSIAEVIPGKTINC